MTSKKMKVEDLKKSESKIEELKDVQRKADADLESMSNINEFSIDSECKDKNGDKTKVLVIDTDADGYLGEFLELGNPFSFSEKGEIKEDGKTLAKYISFMSNIDLDDKQNQKAVGMNALSKARSLVSDFFTLNLVSSVRLEAVTEK